MNFGYESNYICIFFIGRKSYCNLFKNDITDILIKNIIYIFVYSDTFRLEKFLKNFGGENAGGQNSLQVKINNIKNLNKVYKIIYCVISRVK